MTQDQEHLITLLFVKYGSLQAVLDVWLHGTNELSTAEVIAVDAWLNSTEIDRPYNVQKFQTEDNSRALILEIPIDLPDKD